MAGLIKKISITVLFCMGLLFQYCENPSSADNPNPKRFDGITSATGEYFHIDSVRVSPTFADLYWWDHWDDGDTQMVKYGTDETYSLGTINLKPVTPEITTKTTIAPLLPGTRYYVQFYRSWAEDNGSVSIDFTTPTSVP